MAPRQPDSLASSGAGELRVRVDAVERDVGHIEQQVNAIRDAMATKADIQAIFARIEGLSNQYGALSRPNYGLLVSIVTAAMIFLGMIGAFAYWPIRDATTDLKSNFTFLANNAIMQKQYEADQSISKDDRRAMRADLNITIQQQRYNADMARIYSELSILREKSLTRAEFDAQHRDLQRYIDAQLKPR